MYLHATTKNEKARNASHGTGKPHAGAIYTYTAQSTISSSACYFDALHFLSVLPRGKLHQSNVLPDINDWFYYGHERRRWRNPRRQKGLQLCLSQGRSSFVTAARFQLLRSGQRTDEQAICSLIGYARIHDRCSPILNCCGTSWIVLVVRSIHRRGSTTGRRRAASARVRGSWFGRTETPTKATSTTAYGTAKVCNRIANRSLLIP